MPCRCDPSTFYSPSSPMLITPLPNITITLVHCLATITGIELVKAEDFGTWWFTIEVMGDSLYQVCGTPNIPCDLTDQVSYDRARNIPFSLDSTLNTLSRRLRCSSSWVTGGRRPSIQYVGDRIPPSSRTAGSFGFSSSTSIQMDM